MITISHADGAHNKAVIFKANNSQSAITVILLPAMGVKATFYKRLAVHLRAAGFNVLLMDWRGLGSSSIRPNRKTDFGYQQLIDDSKDLVTLANQEFPEGKKIIFGHSLGGQIGALLASRYSHEFVGLVLITSCNVYYKGWSGIAKLKVLLAGITFYPFSLIAGYFPGNKIGFGAKEARTVMKDCCRNALTGIYKLTASSFNYDVALSRLQLPVLALSVKDDKLASEASVMNLCKKFNSAAPVTCISLTETDIQISPLNHFSWIKNPDYIIQLLNKWLTAQA